MSESKAQASASNSQMWKGRMGRDYQSTLLLRSRYTSRSGLAGGFKHGDLC